MCLHGSPVPSQNAQGPSYKCLEAAFFLKSMIITMEVNLEILTRINKYWEALRIIVGS